MNSPTQSDEFTLKDTEFRMFADLVREHAGLDFGESSRFLLERRLSRRVRELELGSFAASPITTAFATAAAAPKNCPT